MYDYILFTIPWRLEMKTLYENEQMEQACKKIKEMLPDSDAIDQTGSSQYSNTEISHDFTRKDLKRIIVSKCKFIDSKFNGAAATGSKFSNTIFLNCDFSGANFQYCYFLKSSFTEKSLARGTNFSHSVFIDCTFHTSTIIECTLFDCLFENCTFLASTIRTDTLENTMMRNCKLERIDLAHINLDYMQWESLKMKNVILPPYQIPYIIGAPCYIKNTVDDIKIYTDNGNIECQEYYALYDELAAFFYSHGEYFPLANIYIALDNHELAYECICLGIQEACDYYDFRMVKHFCKLACSNANFSHTQLKEIYDLITDISYNNSWDLNTLHSYLLNIGEIRELLLNNVSHAQRVEIVLKTNIQKDDLSAVNCLYKQINEILRDNCSNKHIDSVELRHNSPYEFYITCVDMLPNVLGVIGAMYSILVASNKFVNIYKNFEEARRVHQQNDFYKYELEEKKLDIQIKKEQLEQMTNQAFALKSSGIYMVNEIEHSIKCSNMDVAKNIAPEYLHYKYCKNLPEQ